MSEISMEKLSETLAKELSQYSAQVAEGVKQAANRTMKELVADTRRDAPRASGAYKKAISSKTAFQNRYENRKLWYVKKRHCGLPHLLEYGHQLRNGGRSRPFPHIKKNAEAAQERFEERVKKVLEDGR